VVIVGTDRSVYSPGLPADKTYKQLMLEQLDLDMSRVHFVGVLPRGQYRRVLQASTVHVYLTRPFVLSWSILEAMSAGCTLVASATPPVTEVVNDKVNGLLADFRSPAHIAARIEEALEDKVLRRGLSIRARETILDRYRKEDTVAKQMKYIMSFMHGKE
jgi:glycosyltransferase involved in cell wall biosynthesis